MKKTAITIIVLLLPLGAFAQSLITPDGADYALSVEAEIGYIGFLHHTYQNGKPGTNFDYIKQGGQDILYPSQRFAGEVALKNRHIINFLYQPLEVVTRVSFDDAVLIDQVPFPADTPMELRYSFPFWRLTYFYNFLAHTGQEASIGAALQLRNASIRFQSLNNITDEDMVVSQNLGPVPALAVRGKYTFPKGYFIGAEATGLYASSAIINGADFEFEGSILDASIQGGVLLRGGAESYLKFRFLGGTSKGNSEYTERTWTESVSTYGENFLATFVLTLGFRLR